MSKDLQPFQQTVLPPLGMMAAVTETEFQGNLKKGYLEFY